MVNTPLLTSGSSTLSSVILRDRGRVISMSSTDPWYRLMRAAADLFIAGEIDAEELSDMETRWSVRFGRLAEYECPAAREILGSIGLTLIEPKCICDPYEGPCDCPPSDRRERLRDLIGV